MLWKHPFHQKNVEKSSNRVTIVSSQIGEIVSADHCGPPVQTESGNLRVLVFAEHASRAVSLVAVREVLSTAAVHFIFAFLL